MRLSASRTDICSYSHVLGSEDCNNTLIMIQPTLMAYKPEEDAKATLLDSVSIAPDVVLQLDTFFHVLIWHGETVAAWRKAGYHEQEGYEHIKEQMEKPVEDAAVSRIFLAIGSVADMMVRSNLLRSDSRSRDISSAMLAARKLDSCCQSSIHRPRISPAATAQQVRAAPSLPTMSRCRFSWSI